jgi:urease accessory protein
MSASALPALLQLASPALPVGAYSYSPGLEPAIDAGIVRDEATAGRWIDDGMRHVLARYEAPVWRRLHRALSDNATDTVAQWNEEFLATRETAELRAETVQMGYSLMQLLRSLEPRHPERSEGSVAPLRMTGRLIDAHEIAFPTAHAAACVAWHVSEDDGLVAYLYGWAENQVMAALKTIPLGQSAGQRLLLGLRPTLDECARTSRDLPDDALSTQTPALALLSSWHETQYSRLFRS